MAVSQAKPLEPSKLQDGNFETHDKQVNNTLKRNPKMALSRTDLLKLLSYLEAELQARELVIATLKSERVKHIVMQAKMGHFKPNDPYLALQRDSHAAVDPQMDEGTLKAMYDNQLEKLEQLIQHQRRAMNRMNCHLEDAEHCYSKALQELEEEKRKHEHDTAQGDDVTYALEKERTRLKQELETEKQTRKKLEKEIKKLEESIEEERVRVKNIVLLLLAERKKIIIKWVEERKRSEDLAQILSEEKCRLDCMAEGLEEESKKSLEMEEQLEKKSAEFDSERQFFKNLLSKSDQRIQELELELEKARSETASIKKQLEEAHQVAMFQAGTTVTTPAKMIIKTRPPQNNVKVSMATGSPGNPASRMNAPSVMNPPIVGTKPSGAMRSPTPGSNPSISLSTESSLSAQPVNSSLTKTVQPTASISSVPVSGPATGVAQSVQPRGVLSSLRCTIPVSPTSLNGDNVFHNVNAPDVTVPNTSSNSLMERASQGQGSPRVTVTGTSPKLLTSGQGGKVTFQVSQGSVYTSTPTTGINTQVRKPVSMGRGVPPPVPPNKPVIVPKKDVRTSSQSPEVISDHGQPLNFAVKSPKSISSPSVKFGITISKEKIHLSVPSASEQLSTISNSVQNPSKEGVTSLTPSVSTTPSQSQVGALPSHLLQVDESEPGLHDLNHFSQSVDSLGQELINFHQLLCSMAQGKGMERFL